MQQAEREAAGLEEDEGEDEEGGSDDEGAPCSRWNTCCSQAALAVVHLPVSPPKL